MDRERFERIALACGYGSAAAAMASIAASQILLGVALAAFLLSRRRWEWPEGSRFLWIFVAWTLVALTFSPEPAAGWPQIRKLYVLTALPLLATVTAAQRRPLEFVLMRKDASRLIPVDPARWLAFGWVALGTLSSLWALQQFARKWMAAEAAGEEFYLSYIAARITGFNSHWMTFSGQMMIALIAGLALLLWGGCGNRTRVFLIGCLTVIAAALVLAFTRGVWIATAVSALYLLWNWKRAAVLALPVLAAAVLAAGPASLRERVFSLVQPRGQIDSNSHRVATFMTGIEMIRSNSLLGVGPERVGREFDRYAPDEVKPLPVGFYGHLHNIYLQTAAERGIPAMLALVAFLVTPLLVWLRRLWRGAEPRWLLHAGVAAMIGILVTGLFEHNLGDSEILMLVLSVVAVVSRTPAPAAVPPGRPT